MLDLTDLKLIAAIAGNGSPRKAALALRTHPATVYRRLNAIERQLGVPIFDKSGSRYVSLQLAGEILSRAKVIDDQLIELNRHLSGKDARLSGAITVTTSDTLAPLVADALAAFSRPHPEIGLHLVTSNAMADMGRHEADIAVRPTRTPPETLVGRKVAAFAYAIYASKKIAAAARKAGASLDGAWIGLDDTLAAIPAARWLTERVPKERFALRTNSMLTAAEAASAGHGKALLPAYLGDNPAHGLARIGDPIRDLTSEVWVLTHPDLRHTPRIRACTQALAERLKTSLP